MSQGDPANTGARPPKICQICADDCSVKPRVKDAHGRYYCKACADAAAAAKTGPAPEPLSTEPDPEDLLPPEYFDDQIDLEPAEPTRRAGPCPVCMRPLAPDTGRCHSCGYDPAKGIDSSRRVSKSIGGKGPRIACTKCGYDMSGLRTLRCPECGAIRPPDAKDLTRGPSRPILEALRVPAILFVVGILGLTVVGLIIGQPFLSLFVLGSYIVTVPIGLLVFYICCLIWIGFDAPFYLNAAALVGTYAITDLVSAVVAPLGCFGWGIQMFVYVGVLSQLLDLELADALILAVLTGVVKIVLALILIYALAGGI